MPLTSLFNIFGKTNDSNLSKSKYGIYAIGTATIGMFGFFAYKYYKFCLTRTEAKADEDQTNKLLQKASLFEIKLPPHDESYQKELKYLSRQAIRDMFPGCPDQETDYDKHAEFIGININGKLAGVTRLILVNKEKPNESFQANEYPEHLKNCISQTIPIEKIAEISRVYVSKEYRGQGGFIALLKGTLELCETHGVTHVFSMVNPNLNEKYKKYGLHYSACSEPFDVSYKKIGIYETIYFTEIQTLINQIPYKKLQDFLTSNIKPYNNNPTPSQTL